MEEWRKRTGEPGFQPGEYRFEEEPEGTAEKKRRDAVDGYLKMGYSFAPKLESLGGRAV